MGENTSRKQDGRGFYLSHEADMARMERIIRRLWILLIIIFVLYAASNLVWVIYEMGYQNVDTTVQTVEQQADNDSNVYFAGGDMYGGQTESENNAG
jgi:cell division septal protein FtsQ